MIDAVAAQLAGASSRLAEASLLAFQAGERENAKTLDHMAYELALEALDRVRMALAAQRIRLD
jgi:hypothetical protein